MRIRIASKGLWHITLWMLVRFIDFLSRLLATVVCAVLSPEHEMTRQISFILLFISLEGSQCCMWNCMIVFIDWAIFAFRAHKSALIWQLKFLTAIRYYCEKLSRSFPLFLLKINWKIFCLAMINVDIRNERILSRISRTYNNLSEIVKDFVRERHIKINL